MNKLLILLALLPLSGCVGEGDVFPVPFPAGGGGGYSAPAPAPARPAPQASPVAPGAHKMLNDPEAREEPMSDYVWASDSAEADRLCRRMAERWGVRYDSVREANSWTNKAGKRRYTCYFTRFVEGGSNVPDDRN